MHQRNAIGNAVVQAHQQRAALPIMLDVVHLPQRLGEIERRAHQVADKFLQRGLVARRRQRDTMNVRIEIKIMIGDPVGFVALLHHLMLETTKAIQPSVLHGVAQAGDVKRFVENVKARHHHEIGWVFHMKPGCVYIA